MSTDQKTESTAAEPAAPATSTAQSIRAIMRNKADAMAARGPRPDGRDVKVPSPPYGTRRSMGKR